MHNGHSYQEYCNHTQLVSPSPIVCASFTYYFIIVVDLFEMKTRVHLFDNITIYYCVGVELSFRP